MQSYDFYFIYVCLCLKILIYSAYLRGAAVSAAPTKQTVLSPGGAAVSAAPTKQTMLSPGGAAVSAAPTKQVVPSTLLVHLRQVHPL